METTTIRKNHRGLLVILAASISSPALCQEGEEDTFELTWEVELVSEQQRNLSLSETETRQRLYGAEASASLRYSINSNFTAFAEMKALIVREPGDDEDSIHSERSLERGELWLRWEPIAEGPFSIKLGRQEFSEDRQWWWDDDLDALRVDYNAVPWQFSASLARETGPDSNIEDRLDPAEKDVVRALAHARRDWDSGFSLQGFALVQHDRSSRHAQDEIVSSEDESDADLSWLGLRAIGETGALAWRVDAAGVWGSERRTEYEETKAGFVVVDRSHRDVRGWALDAGGTFTLPLEPEPVLYLGYALASGDSNPESRTNRAFRQSSINSNEQQFRYYGELLNPELSNLGILSIGVDWPLSNDATLSLYHHRYRKREAATETGESAIEEEANGTSKDLGREWDLVYQLENESGFALEASASAFRAGRAFEGMSGEYAYRIYFQVNYEF